MTTVGSTFLKTVDIQKWPQTEYSLKACVRDNHRIYEDLVTADDFLLSNVSPSR